MHLVIIKHNKKMELKKYSLLLLLSVFIVFSCTDDSLIPEPVPLTAVHGYIENKSDQGVGGSQVENFLYDEVSDVLMFDFSWVSIGDVNTVTKIDFYISFNEVYTDFEGGSVTASHTEYLFKTVDSPPANRETLSMSLSQADVYDIYKDDTFAYDITDGDDAAQSIFGFAQKANRDVTSSPFVAGDSFSIRWVLTTADGRVFSTWNDSICLEFPGANCTFNWAVLCSQTLPVGTAGDIVITGTESYGDGWNDAGLEVLINGVVSETLAIDSSTGTDAVVWTISLDGSETSVSFNFVSGDYDSEITFDIVWIEGTTVASWGPTPPVGKVIVDLCSL